MERVGLTGASGMLGQHLLELFRSESIDCLATSRRTPRSLSPKARWQSWDLSRRMSMEELDQLFPGVDAIVHAGAIVPSANQFVDGATLIEANVRAVYDLGHWALNRSIPMVYISGATVYANPLSAGIREADPKTTGAAVGGLYGLSKQLAELVLENLAAAGLNLIVLRPSSIYGHGLSDGKMVSSFVQQASLGQPIVVTPPAGDSFDLVHASDVARAALQSLRAGARGAYNVGGGLVTVQELARTCISASGKGHIEVGINPHVRSPRIHFGLDCSKALQDFGYLPRISILEGISLMLLASTESTWIP